MNADSAPGEGLPMPTLKVRERVCFPYSKNTWTSTQQKCKIRRVARKALGPSKLATHKKLATHRQPTSKTQPCVCVQLRVAVSSSDSGSIHIPPKRSASRFLFFFSGITVLLTLTTCNSATDPPRPKVTIEQNAARAQSASAETANHGLAFESLSQNICL